MNAIEESEIQCPYCGEFNTLLLDCSGGEQDYFEDCQACCCPIEIHLLVGDDGNYQLSARRDSE